MEELDIYEMSSELYEAASLEGTELGDYWLSLSSFVDQVDGGIASDEFQQAFLKELTAQYKDFKENFKIIQEEETVTKMRKVLVPK